MIIRYIKSNVAAGMRHPSDKWIHKLVFQYMSIKNNYLEKAAVKLSQIEPHHHVLEVGFGPGLGLDAAYKIIKDGDGKINGVDISPYVIATAQRKFKGIISTNKMEIHQANVAHLPYLDNEFDRVFHCNSFYFWPDLPICIRELYRVMKPKSAMITTLNLDWIKVAKGKGILTNAHTDPLNYMIALENCGFQNVCIEYFKYKNYKYQAIHAEILSK